MTRTAVVTGAAGGIGTSICDRLRRDGWFTVGVDQKPSGSADLDVLQDLADLEGVARIAHEIGEEHEVGAVVHNAAVQPLGGAGEVSWSAWMEAFGVNVVAADVLVGALVGRLRAAHGSVVVVGSVHGRATTRGIVAYATSKAALEGWVRAAALDLAPEVRVNAVIPGAIDTAKLREGFDRWGPDEAVARRKVLADRTPSGRIGSPSEVAGLVSFLLSDDSSFVTGEAMVVDGGASVRLGSE